MLGVCGVISILLWIHALYYSELALLSLLDFTLHHPCGWTSPDQYANENESGTTQFISNSKGPYQRAPTQTSGCNWIDLQPIRAPRPVTNQRQPSWLLKFLSGVPKGPCSVQSTYQHPPPPPNGINSCDWPDSGQVCGKSLWYKNMSSQIVWYPEYYPGAICRQLHLELIFHLGSHLISPTPLTCNASPVDCHHTIHSHSAYINVITQ